MNKYTTITFCPSQNIPGVYFREGGIFWTVTPANHLNTRELNGVLA